MDFNNHFKIQQPKLVPRRSLCSEAQKQTTSYLRQCHGVKRERLYNKLAASCRFLANSKNWRQSKNSAKMPPRLGRNISWLVTATSPKAYANEGNPQPA
jgi:hypothetical protein